MLEFLHTIFQINNFDIEEIEHNKLISKFAYQNKENKNQEFYLILDCSSKIIDFSGDNINETLEELMNKIDRSIYSDESTKKNTTLILCVNELDITVQDLLRIEENPYYFKKM